MFTVQQPKVRNRLLASLDENDFENFSSHLKPIDLSAGFELARANEAIDYAYFLESGIGTIVAESSEGHRVEVGLLGCDGFAPVTLLTDFKNNSLDVCMRLQGHGYRMEASLFREKLNSHPQFEKLLRRYVQTLTTQTNYTVLSNAAHRINERLARWILMCHDRVDGDDIPLTHAFLASMLAIRRASVTTALHKLESKLYIKNYRGVITVTNRAALEAFASDAYGKPEEEHRRLVGPMPLHV